MGYLRNLFLLFLCFKRFLKRIFIKMPPRLNQESLNILVMTTGKIGDIVCVTPFLRELKKGKPKSKITVLMYKFTKPLLRFNPNIEEIIEINNYLGALGGLKLTKLIKSKKFDWSFNLLPGPLTNVIPYLADIKNRAIIVVKGQSFMTKISIYFNNQRIFYKRKTLFLDTYLKLLKFLGIRTNNRKKDLYLNKAIESKMNKFLDDKKIKKSSQLNFVISATAGVRLKEWAVNKFALLADNLVNKYNAKIIFIGTRKDRKKINAVISLMKQPAIDLSGLLTLEELPYLMKRADLFIGVDTGPLYIANALNKPVVLIAGPVDIYSQPPIYEKCETVMKNIYCQPCSFMGEPARRCPEGHLRCLKETTVEDVFRAVERSLQKNYKSFLSKK